MNENNAKILKIQKSGKIALTAVNIVKIICIVCAVITFIAGCFCFIQREYIDREFKAAMESGELTVGDVVGQEGAVNLTFGNILVIDDVDELIEDGYTGETLGAYVITMSVILVCMAVVLHFVGKVFKDFMKEYSPFQPSILKNLKVALVLLTVFVFHSSAGIGVIVALASWCILNIFEYGCELQKQSDETL